MTDRARVVVIGGGITGCSVAYHLAAAGWTDVILLDKGELTSGATMHAAGLVTAFNPSPTMMWFRRYSIELYEKLGVFEAVGSLRIASSREQLSELRRGVSRARGIGLEAELLGPEETLDLMPAASATDLHGSVWMPADGYLDPHTATHALAKAASELGVRIHTGERATGIELDGSRRVRAVRTELDAIETETVVDAAGIWAPRVASMVGVRIPSTPVDHQHVVIAAVDGHELPRDMPCFRDPDNLVYGKAETQGLLFGGYEVDPVARWVDGVPWDHGGRSLPPDEQRFEPLMRGAIRRFPFLGGAGMVRMVCHPDAMTPDAQPLLGPVPGVGGFWLAAGVSLNGFGGAGGIGRTLAGWITSGDSDRDVSGYAPWRFGALHEDARWVADLARENYRYYYLQRYPFDHDEWGRPKRTSALHSRLQEAGCVFQVKHGWERPDHFVPGSPWRRAGADQRSYGFTPPPWLEHVEREHRAIRERVGLLDLSSFGKIEVVGAGAASLLDRVCANRIDVEVGRIVVSPLLSVGGGIVGDVTVTRLEPERFMVVTGAAAVDRDAGWLRMNVREDDAAISISDVTEELAVIGVWGAMSHTLLEDLGAELPARRQAVQTTLGGVPVLAQGMCFAGGPGWELFVEPRSAVQVWDELQTAGERHGITLCGYRAIDGLRLEAGFRVIGTDLTATDDPFEAGLGSLVALDGRDFVGADALRARVQPERDLFTLGLGDGGYVCAYGGEAVSSRGEVIGRLRSSSFGFTVGRHLATAYLPAGTSLGDLFDVDVFGEPVVAEVLPRAPLAGGAA